MAFAMHRRGGISRRLRRAASIAGVSLAALLGAGISAHAITIEIDDVAPDRVERQRAFAAGSLPLQGTPDLAQLDARLAAKGLKAGAAMMIRIFKSESELEVWMEKDGRYVLFDTYPICHWAGTVGPKLREGDRQNPEGFYSVGPRQLHRIGRWPRSLNVGFPNTYDRAHGRTGSYILVHGGCSSVGCFAMTNAVMAEIFQLTEHALKAGQQKIGLHVFPFRMTEANLTQHAQSPWIDFWRNLKEGYDAFEETRLPPRIGICDRRYVVEQQRPGEVGVEGPLALCGVSHAALIEPSSQSIAPLPPDWPRQTLQEAPAPQSTELLPQLQRSAYSGEHLPPPPTLAQQSVLQLPRPLHSQSRQQQAAQLPPQLLRVPKLATAAPAALAVEARPPCNIGLASCRKFLALTSTTDGRGRISPQAGRELSRALSRLTAPPATLPSPGAPQHRRSAR